MKVLHAVAPVAKAPWTSKVTCGPVKGGPPIGGCGTQCQLELQDVFRRVVSDGNAMGYSFHWRCPICNVTNAMLVSDIPHSEVQTEKKFLTSLRENTMIEIAKLHEVHERPSVVEDLGLSFFLDEVTIEKVLKNKELYN